MTNYSYIDLTGSIYPQEFEPYNQFFALPFFKIFSLLDLTFLNSPIASCASGDFARHGAISLDIRPHRLAWHDIAYLSAAFVTKIAFESALLLMNKTNVIVESEPGKLTRFVVRN